GLEQKLLDVLQRWMNNPERIVSVHIDELLIRFDRRQRHPIERKKQDDDDDEQRKIERDKTVQRCLEVAHTLGVVAGRKDRRWLCDMVSHCRFLAATCAAACRTMRS